MCHNNEKIMPIQDYFLNNLVMIFELVGILLILFITVNLSRKMKILTRLTVGLLFFSVIVTALESWTQTFTTLSMWRPILTSFKYIAYPSVMVVLIFVVCEIGKPISWKWIFVLVPPILITFIIYITSQWTHLVFHYSSENHWGGGSLRLLPYIFFVIYLVVFVVLNIINLRYYSFKNRFIALYISIASAAIVVIYFITGRTEDYNPLFTASLVFYFLFIHIHFANIDALTGLMNRQSYYQCLEDKKNSITFIVSIDMNDLKLINDNHGHAAGDKALLTIAQVLMALAGNKAGVFRVGGDEFMILFYDMKEDEVKNRIKLIKEKLEETPYSCAFGYAEHNYGTYVEESIKRADEQMYLDKAKSKRKNKTK